MEFDELKLEIEQIIAAAKPANVYFGTIPQLFHCNLARGRGLFAQSILRTVVSDEANDTQLATLAALVAVVNSKLPVIGKLVLFQAKSTFSSFAKSGCNLRDNRSKMCQFIVLLCNQGVCGEILPLEMLLGLLERVKLGSGDLLFQFIVDLVYKFGNHMSSRTSLVSALDSLFQGLRENAAGNAARTVLVNELERVRLTGFALFPVIPQRELDLLLPGAGILHEIFLDDEAPVQVSDCEYYTVSPPATSRERIAKQDQAWLMYQRQCLAGILPDEEEEEEVPAASPPPAAATQAAAQPKVVIDDRTSHNVEEIRRRIYLTLTHGISFEQTAHELITQRNRMLKGYDSEICQMLVQYTAEQKSYTDFLGLLCSRLCVAIPKDPLVPLFEREFAKQYENAHMLETTKLRNVSTLLAEMLYRDRLSWKTVFSSVELSETTTTSSSRIYLKFLFERLTELMGVDGLRQKLQPLEDFPGLFPQGKRAKQVRFAINFFTNIKLGILTVDMRQWLAQGLAQEDSDDSSSVSSSSSSSDSEREARKKKKKRSKSSKKKKSKRSKKSKD